MGPGGISRKRVPVAAKIAFSSVAAVGRTGEGHRHGPRISVQRTPAFHAPVPSRRSGTQAGNTGRPMRNSDIRLRRDARDAITGGFDPRVKARLSIAKSGSQRGVQPARGKTGTKCDAPRALATDPINTHAAEFCLRPWRRLRTCSRATDQARISAPHPIARKSPDKSRRCRLCGFDGPT